MSDKKHFLSPIVNAVLVRNIAIAIAIASSAETKSVLARFKTNKCG
ncbi:hypothetical protein QWY77_01180 [Thalassotalea ponticola]|nr:hypothetical protein [Thalassotalea ponticola]MDN3651398.1 hypothetical protein [Thalassotalea ponticola]